MPLSEKWQAELAHLESEHIEPFKRLETFDLMRELIQDTIGSPDKLHPEYID